jgi:DNA polymerase
MGDAAVPGTTLGAPAREDGPATPASRAAALAEIAEEIRACTACRLHRGRTHAVPGEGSPETEVVFVGEGPGQNEDQQGRPFVGAAGGLLEELLALVGWRREDVFITNVVKCRPPGNRDPEPDEIAACAGFLRRQLEVLDPALVVTLGRFSLGTFMPGARISSVHGTVRPVDPATGARSAVVCAMYHPAAAFRQTALKETLAVDMANLPQILLDARSARAAEEPIRPVGEAGGGPETPETGPAAGEHAEACGPVTAAELVAPPGGLGPETETQSAEVANGEGFDQAVAPPLSTDAHPTQGGEQTDQMTLF